MLPRTVLLLFLCVSAGMCATLGLYQAQAKEEEEVPAVSDTAAAEVEVAEEVVAPADATAQIQDTHAAEEPEDNSVFGDNFQPEIVKLDAVKPEVEIPELEVDATNEETVNDIDRDAGDVKVTEEVTQDKPSSDDIGNQETTLEDGGNQEKPSEDVGDQEKTSEDDENQEKTSDDAVNQEIHPDVQAVNMEKTSDEEKGNEIEPLQTQQSSATEESSWGLNSIRSSFQSMHGYFDSLVELVGGHDGVCQYRCRYGELPQPRPGYQIPEPNGCSSSLVGYQFDMGIPAMTKCCNLLDMCYDTCGASKYDCDSAFRSCMHDICTDINKSLGFVSKVEACESVADTLFNTVWTLGCRPYMNSQRAACVCADEERDEL